MAIQKELALASSSPLSQGRELKLACDYSPRYRLNVAPLAGAGIEIGLVHMYTAAPFVAPLAGAGIEILKSSCGPNGKVWSPLSQGRELKCGGYGWNNQRGSRPSRRGGN